MPELLLQSALAASKSRELAVQAAQIKADCHAQHGDSKSLVSCPPCYGALLEALRARFLSSGAGPSATGTPPDQQHPQRQREEWFTSRRAFLSALELLIDSAKEYQISPQAIDDRVREERSSWYAERVRGSLLRLMVEDAVARSAVFEKLEDSSAASAAEGDPVRLAREVAEILSRGPLAAGEGPDTHLLERLATAEDEIGTIEVLEEMFFAGEDGTVPEDDQKYLDMLLHHGLTMEQVVDRILEERQAAVGAREQTAKLKARLDELRRARAAHEAHKSRKARRRESLAQQKAPDELYALPPCAVCGEAPSTKSFFCCTLCTILAGHGVQEKQTVFCSKKCEDKGYVSTLPSFLLPPSSPRPLTSNTNTPSQASHTDTHICSSAWDCIQVHPRPQPTPSWGGEEDASSSTMDEEPSPTNNPNNLHPHFCTECLTTLKQPTTWCSAACAAANFQCHRDEVHLPARKALGLQVDDEARLEYLGDGDHDRNGGGGGRNRRRYRARDIRALTISLEEAVKEWEGRNRVPLQSTG